MAEDEWEAGDPPSEEEEEPVSSALATQDAPAPAAPEEFKFLDEYSGFEDPLARYNGGYVPEPQPNVIQFHSKIADALFSACRYKILEGGRGGMKSWGVARCLLILALQRRLRILCTREYMTSIEDSVYKLLIDQIRDMNMGAWFTATRRSIYSTSGSEFLFTGLADLQQLKSRTKVKSFEGIDICWVEEAETITDESWQLLIPTIRKPGSEIWVVYNPNLATDATYRRFHDDPPKGARVVVINWRDNLWLSRELSMEKDHLFRTDPEAAAHVWDGELRKHAEAAVFRGKFVIHNFESPLMARWLHGVDFGFAEDPTVMLRMFITGKPPHEELWIDEEAWQVGVEINEMAQNYLDDHSKAGLFDKIKTCRTWPVRADSARPEIVSYLKRNAAMNIEPAEKWAGSIEDGIAHLRGFDTIHIHKDHCPHTALEFRLYSYKIDKMTGEILPVVVDKNNHCPDACRYALDDFIKRRGVAAIWARLGRRA